MRKGALAIASGALTIPYVAGCSRREVNKRSMHTGLTTVQRMTKNDEDRELLHYAVIAHLQNRRQNVGSG